MALRALPEGGLGCNEADDRADPDAHGAESLGLLLRPPADEWARRSSGGKGEGIGGCESHRQEVPVQPQAVPGLLKRTSHGLKTATQRELSIRSACSATREIAVHAAADPLRPSHGISRAVFFHGFAEAAPFRIFRIFRIFRSDIYRTSRVRLLHRMRPSARYMHPTVYLPAIFLGGAGRQSGV